MRLLLILLLLVLSAPRPTRAASWPDDRFIALPCRPTVACTADIVGVGMFEVEAGYLLRRGAEGASHATPFLLKYTVFPWLQLQAGGNGLLRSAGSSEFDDVLAGVKLHLRDQDEALPSIAVSAFLGVPTGPDGEERRRTTNGLFALYVTREKGIVHGDLNLGVNLYQLAGPPSLQIWGALAVSVALPHQFTLMGELWGQSDAQPAAGRDAGFLFALAYAPRPYLIFDVGGDAGLLRDVRAVSFFAGLTAIPFSTATRR